jgi:hypothetical protein
MPVDPPQTESPDEFLRPLCRPVPELERLCGVLNRARQRQPGLVVVEGREGIGETAPVRQLLRPAEEPCVLYTSDNDLVYGTSRSAYKAAALYGVASYDA